MLNQFEGEPDHDLGLKLLFARAGVLFDRHPDHANEIIYSLRLINEEEHVPRDMRAQLAVLNHDLEQYKQALITQHDLEQSVSGFLSPYAVYRPQLEQIDLTR